MATKKEERERRRAERLAAERRQSDTQRRRLILGYIVAGGLGAAVLFGIVLAIAGGGGGDEDNPEQGDLPSQAFIQTATGTVDGVAPDDREGTPPPAIEQGDLEASAEEAGCELRLNLPDEGNAHVEANTVDYKTDPPTSGDHNIDPQADGAYADMPDPIHFVHSLEHGRVEVQYSPDLPEDQQLELKGVFDEDPGGMMFFPNPEMKFDVAATAWTQMLACPAYEGGATLDAIRNFRDTYRGNGPENVPLQF